ncbi:hypothetical protein [Cupriavidus sp. CP313]
MRSVRTAVGAVSTAILLWPGLQALAEPQPSGPPAAPVASNAGIAAPTSATAPDLAPATGALSSQRGALAGFGKPVASDKLGEIRGGAEVVVSDMRLHGTVADNAATNTLSGSNIVNGGAFSNAAGIPTAIQNSGSNVLIQNATIVNVQFK